MVCGQLYIVSFDSLHGRLACCCGLLRFMQLCLADPAIARIACTAIPYILCYRFPRVNSQWSGLCYGYREKTTNCMYAHAFVTSSRRCFAHIGEAARVDASPQDCPTLCLTLLSATPLRCPVCHVGHFLSPHPPLLARAFESNNNRGAQQSVIP